MPGIDLSRRFGRAVRRRREKAGVSQEELAHRAGVTRNHISLLERGLRNPTLNVVAMIASGLRTSLLALIRDLESSD